MALVMQRIDQAEKEAEAGRKALYGETEVPETKTPEEQGAERVAAEELAAKEKAEAEALAAKEKEEKDYKARYDTLKGKYDKEIPNALAEARTARTEADQLRGQVTGFQTEIAGLKAEITALHAKRTESETDADLEELEADNPILAKLLKKERESHKAEIKALTDKISQGTSAEIKEIKSKLEESADDTFDRKMSELVGNDWKDIDKDPEFIATLEELVPYTRFKKLAVLQDAAKRRDAEVVSKFFLDYKAQLTAKAEAAKTATGKGLEKFVAPPKGGSPGAPVGAGAETGFTLEDYKVFMDQTTRGKFNPKDPRWKGKNEEQVEAIFDKLASEGNLK